MWKRVFSLKFPSILSEFVPLEFPKEILFHLWRRLRKVRLDWANVLWVLLFHVYWTKSEKKTTFVIDVVGIFFESSVQFLCTVRVRLYWSKSESESEETSTSNLDREFNSMHALGSTKDQSKKLLSHLLSFSANEPLTSKKNTGTL